MKLDALTGIKHRSFPHLNSRLPVWKHSLYNLSLAIQPDDGLFELDRRHPHRPK